MPKTIFGVRILAPMGNRRVVYELAVGREGFIHTEAAMEGQVLCKMVLWLCSPDSLSCEQIFLDASLRLHIIIQNCFYTKWTLPS